MGRRPLLRNVFNATFGPFFLSDHRAKKMACILHKLTIEFTQNMIRLFWVQQWLDARHLILAWQVPEEQLQFLGYFHPNCPLSSGHFLRATFQ